MLALRVPFLLALLLLTPHLGVEAQGRDGGDVVTTTTHTESNASASASASSSTTTTTTTIPSDDDDDDDDDEAPHRRRGNAAHRSERNVTERVRDAILEADIDGVASLLREVEDSVLLGLGFTFPTHLREENVIITRNRVRDPDVVSLKAMATVALDEDFVERLTEVFIVAVYGQHFDSNLCPEDPEYTETRTVIRNRTIVSSGYTQVFNESGNFTSHDTPQVINSYHEESITDDIDFVIEAEEAMGSMAAEEEPEPAPDCYTQEEIEIIRENLRADFSDEDLMTSIVEGDPQRRSRRERSLLVVGTPVSTWLCASCWKPKFCNKHVYWCPQ